MTSVADTQAGCISLRNVEKLYALQRAGLAQLWRGSAKTPDSIHRALAGISLDIPPGESVGILGLNGAGKSTLLQIISGTLRPTSGDVRAFGRISALLELGAGFNPEWTGRQNAEFQCVLQGVPNERLAETLRAIETFADIGSYFEQPTRTYSSGMFLRVAFAAAVTTDPDILIVDEALAVGDLRFQNKCYRRFEEMQERGCTVLFVTHSPDLVVRFCKRAIILDRGRLVFDGEPADAAKMYMNMITGAALRLSGSDAQSESAALACDGGKQIPDFAGQIRDATSNQSEEPPWEGALSSRSHYNSEELRSGDGHIEIVDALLHGGDFVEITDPIRPGQKLFLSVKIAVRRDLVSPEVGIIVRSKMHQVLSGATNWMIGGELPSLKSPTQIYMHWSFEANYLTGDYFIDVGTSDLIAGERRVGDLRQSLLHFSVSSPSPVFGLVDARINVVGWRQRVEAS
jgi:lipopolysaccharide transport system ATP-binding protein